ncbi:MAG: hypothetical protein GY778_17370 [bacterium]|nr:hypothetical protein [bacterium]
MSNRGLHVWWAVLCNVVAPGSGLITLRREWLGLTLALLFCLLAQIALLGVWVVPATIPRWVTTASFSVAVFVWLAAQWRLWDRIRLATGPELERQLSALRQRAADAQARNDHAEAIEILQVAMTLNDEDLAANLHWAQIMTTVGRFRPARAAWRRVLRLDRTGQHSREAIEALAALPDC